MSHRRGHLVVFVKRDSPGHAGPALFFPGTFVEKNIYPKYPFTLPNTAFRHETPLFTPNTPFNPPMGVCCANGVFGGEKWCLVAKRGVWGEKGCRRYNGVFRVQMGCFGANRCVGGEKGWRVSWVFGAEMGCF